MLSLKRIYLYLHFYTIERKGVLIMKNNLMKQIAKKKKLELKIAELMKDLKEIYFVDDSNAIDIKFEKWWKKINENDKRDVLLLIKSGLKEEDKLKKNSLYVHMYVKQLAEKLFKPFSLFKDKCSPIQFIYDVKDYNPKDKTHVLSTKCLKENLEKHDRWYNEPFFLKHINRLNHPKYNNLVPQEGKMKQIVVYDNYVKLMKKKGKYYRTASKQSKYEDAKNIAHIVSASKIKCLPSQSFTLSDGKKYVLVTKKSNKLELKPNMIYEDD